MKEANPMAARKIGNKEWYSFLDRLSKEVRSNRAEIGAASLAPSDQIDAQWLPR
jgi:hypothetical protein